MVSKLIILIQILLKKLYVLEPINHVLNNFFSDTDAILDSSPDSPENKNSPSVPPASEMNSKFIDTGSTEQTSSNSEKFTSSFESSKISLRKCVCLIEGFKDVLGKGQGEIFYEL